MAVSYIGAMVITALLVIFAISCHGAPTNSSSSTQNSKTAPVLRDQQFRTLNKTASTPAGNTHVRSGQGAAVKQSSATSSGNFTSSSTIHPSRTARGVKTVSGTTSSPSHVINNRKNENTTSGSLRQKRDVNGSSTTTLHTKSSASHEINANSSTSKPSHPENVFLLNFHASSEEGSEEAPHSSDAEPGSIIANSNIPVRSSFNKTRSPITPNSSKGAGSGTLADHDQRHTSFVSNIEGAENYDTFALIF